MTTVGVFRVLLSGVGLGVLAEFGIEVRGPVRQQFSATLEQVRLLVRGSTMRRVPVRAGPLAPSFLVGWPRCYGSHTGPKYPDTFW